MEAIVDLGQETTINEISIDFLQNNRAWIFLPKYVTAYYSNDNEQFLAIGTIRNIIPEKKGGTFIQTYTISADNLKARFIKVSTEALKTCPDWHIGAGKNSWIFVDEIVIR